MVPALTYGLYAQISATRGATVHRVPMRELEIDLDSVAETARRVDARVVWICDPNNPTGAALEPDEWSAFLRALPDSCVAVVDEAYADFVAPDRRAHREVDIADGRRVIVLRSFSKLYGLAWFAPRLRARGRAARPVLRSPRGAVQRQLRRARGRRAPACGREAAVDERRELVADARARSSDGAPRASASSRFRRRRTSCSARVDVDDVLLGDRLAERGLLIRPGSDYGLPGYVRVTVGPSELMERFGIELRDVCSSLRSPVA